MRQELEIAREQAKSRERVQFEEYLRSNILRQPLLSQLQNGKRIEGGKKNKNKNSSMQSKKGMKGNLI